MDNENDTHLISISDVLDLIHLIEESGIKYTGKLEIESDSCFSGQLCFHAKNEWVKRKSENRIDIEQLSVMAASHKDEKAIWGKWNAFKN